MKSLVGGKGMVNALDFDAGMNVLVSAHDDNQAFVWDFEDGKGQKLAHSAAVISLQVCKKAGNTIVTSCSDGRAYLWEKSSSETVHKQVRCFDAGSNCVVDGLVWSSPAEFNFVLTTSQDVPGIHFWSLAASAGGRESLVPDLRLIHPTPVQHIKMVTNRLITVDSNSIAVVDLKAVVKFGVLDHHKIELSLSDTPIKEQKVKSRTLERSKLWGKYAKAVLNMVITALQLASFGFTKGSSTAAS